MNESVNNFYTKNAEQGYIDQYEKDHGPRLDAVVKHFNLHDIKNKSILDIGGGLGFLGKRLDKSNFYYVLDGAEIPLDKRLCHGQWHNVDLDYHQFGSDDGDNSLNRKNHFPWDMAFCLETIEHCSNPYNVLAEIKKLVKLDGDIYISIPHFNVTHNYIYPGLMANPDNFEQFLAQMALPVQERWLWDQGWNAWHFHCKNRPYSEKQMLFPKHESKFINATPIEMVNW